MATPSLRGAASSQPSEEPQASLRRGRRHRMGEPASSRLLGVSQPVPQMGRPPGRVRTLRGRTESEGARAPEREREKPKSGDGQAASPAAAAVRRPAGPGSRCGPASASGRSIRPSGSRPQPEPPARAGARPYRKRIGSVPIRGRYVTDTAPGDAGRVGTSRRGEAPRGGAW